jgi:hypothetical protein
LVEPIGGNGLDCSGQQLDGCGQVLRHRRRLQPQSSSVCEAGVGELPGSSALHSPGGASGAGSLGR